MTHPHAPTQSNGSDAAGFAAEHSEAVGADPPPPPRAVRRTRRRYIVVYLCILVYTCTMCHMYAHTHTHTRTHRWAAHAAREHRAAVAHARALRRWTQRAAAAAVLGWAARTQIAVLSLGAFVCVCRWVGGCPRVRMRARVLKSSYMMLARRYVYDDLSTRVIYDDLIYAQIITYRLAKITKNYVDICVHVSASTSVHP